MSLDESMPAFRIATYNVLWGGIGREDAIRDVLRGIAPDVAVLTEITTHASLDVLAPAIGAHTAISGPAGWKERTAVVSRWPIVSSETFGPPWNRRKWIAATIQPPDGPSVRVCGIALAAHQMWTHEMWRRAEVRYLLTAARAADDQALLLSGDFNTIARGDTVNVDREPMYVRAQRWLQFGMIARGSLAPLARAGFTDCYRACHPDASGYTIASHNPTARIDYIFASAALRPRLRACDVVDAGAASDHLPLYADFD